MAEAAPSAEARAAKSTISPGHRMILAVAARQRAQKFQTRIFPSRRSAFNTGGGPLLEFGKTALLAGGFALSVKALQELFKLGFLVRGQHGSNLVPGLLPDSFNLGIHHYVHGFIFAL